MREAGRRMGLSLRELVALMGRPTAGRGSLSGRLTHRCRPIAGQASICNSFGGVDAQVSTLSLRFLRFGTCSRAPEAELERFVALTERI